jgi:hypothetical protein
MSKHHQSQSFAAQAIEGRNASEVASGHEMATRVLNEAQYASPMKWSRNNNQNYPDSLECTNCYAEAIPGRSAGRFGKSELAANQAYPAADGLRNAKAYAEAQQAYPEAQQAYPQAQGTLEKMGGALRNLGRSLGIKPSENDRLKDATWED